MTIVLFIPLRCALLAKYQAVGRGTPGLPRPVAEKSVASIPDEK